MYLWIFIIIIFLIIFLFNIKECFDSKPEPFNQYKKPSKKIKIYNFNTKWCGWSKKFQPEFDKLQNTLKNNSNITAIDVKCDDSKNKQMCADNKVPGYPYILIDVNGEKKIAYEGTRTADAILEYINLV